MHPKQRVLLSFWVETQPRRMPPVRAPRRRKCRLQSVKVTYLPLCAWPLGPASQRLGKMPAPKVSKTLGWKDTFCDSVTPASGAWKTRLALEGNINDSKHAVCYNRLISATRRCSAPATFRQQGGRYSPRWCHGYGYGNSAMETCALRHRMRKSQESAATCRDHCHPLLVDICQISTCP